MTLPRNTALGSATVEDPHEATPGSGSAAHDAPKASHIGRRSLFSVFRFTALASASTILLGLASNKAIALLAGTYGVGVLGLYRSLTMAAIGILSPSAATLLVQRVSTAKTRAAAREILRAAWLLFLLQVLVLGGVALLGARPLATLMFDGQAARYTTEVRVVVVLVSGVLGLRLVTAMLNGRVRVRASMGINLLSSALTLVAVYPLMLLGDVGLAMVIGLTCGIAAAVGAIYVWREYGLSRSDLAVSFQQWRILRSMPISLALNVHMVTTSVTMFALQFMISRYYGISALGYYTAAVMIEASLMQVLSSAMVPYYLPSLATLETQEEKNRLVNRMLSMVLCISIPGVLALTLAGGMIVPLLFTREFSPAARLIPVLGVAVLAQCVVWCHAIFLQHKSAFRTYLVLDSVWASLLLGGTALCVHRSWPLEAVVWTYTFSYSVSAALYVVCSLLGYSRGLLSRGLALLLCFLALCAAAYFVFQRIALLQGGLGIAAVHAVFLYRTLQDPPAGDRRSGSGASSQPLPAPGTT